MKYFVNCKTLKRAGNDKHRPFGGGVLLYA